MSEMPSSIPVEPHIIPLPNALGRECETLRTFHPLQVTYNPDSRENLVCRGLAEN
jgi:hypothetical protein